MTEECNVVKVNKKSVVIELFKKPECEGCKACSFNRRSSIKLTAKSDINCCVGDRVVVEMPKKALVGSSLILFAIPLALLIIAAIVTATMQWYVQVAAIATALAMGLTAVIIADRLIRSKPQYLPKIISKINENNNQEGDTHD